jgi:hypothetical protein
MVLCSHGNMCQLMGFGYGSGVTSIFYRYKNVRRGLPVATLSNRLALSPMLADFGTQSLTQYITCQNMPRTTFPWRAKPNLHLRPYQAHADRDGPFFAPTFHIILLKAWFRFHLPRRQLYSILASRDVRCYTVMRASKQFGYLLSSLRVNSTPIL